MLAMSEPSPIHLPLISRLIAILANQRSGYFRCYGIVVMLVTVFSIPSPVFASECGERCCCSDTKAPAESTVQNRQIQVGSSITWIMHEHIEEDCGNCLGSCSSVGCGCDSCACGDIPTPSAIIPLTLRLPLDEWASSLTFAVHTGYTLLAKTIPTTVVNSRESYSREAVFKERLPDPALDNRRTILLV